MVYRIIAGERGIQATYTAKDETERDRMVELLKKKTYKILEIETIYPWSFFI